METGAEASHVEDLTARMQWKEMPEENEGKRAWRETHRPWKRSCRVVDNQWIRVS